MKHLNLTVFVIMFAFTAFGQTDAEKKMEKRGREFYRMITINDKNAWIKFMETNFTKTLQDKPFNRRIQTNGDEKDVVIARPANEETAKLEAKSALFDQLHRDFGTAKLKSLVTKNNESVLTLENNGQTGTLKLKFEEKAPYLIDGLNIQVVNN